MAFRKLEEHEYYTYLGKSTDTKPTDASVKLLDTLFEYDRNRKWKYTQDGWVEMTDDVYVQDQTSEIIDLHLSRLVQAIAITTATSVDDTMVTITSAAEPTDGNIACFKEAQAFYQGTILSHAANGSDWDVVLDTPLDFAYTVLGGCSERDINLAVDGSATTQVFSLSPSGLAAGTKWDVTRMMGQIIDESSMDDAKFGGMAALPKGIVFRKVDGITKNIFNAKTNGDMKAHMYDVAYSDKAPAGFTGLAFRRSFAGQDKNGVVIRLEGDTDDQFQVLIQDDLTELVDFQVIAQGHIVE